MRSSAAAAPRLRARTTVHPSTSIIHHRPSIEHMFRKYYQQTRTIYRLDGFLKSSKIHQRLSQSIKMI